MPNEKDNNESIQQELYATRKVGLPRYFEMVGRDLWAFYRAGFLCAVGFLPGAVLLWFGLMGGSALYSLLGGLLAGLVGAPFVSGMIDTVLRSLRDEPGYWWHTYRMAWKQNWKDALLPGALAGLILGLWAYLLFTLPDMENVPTTVWICMILTIFFLLAIGTYTFAQIVLVSVPLPKLLKNAALFTIGLFPRTLIAVAVQAAYWGVTLAWMPYTLPLVLLTGFWFPCTVALLAIYPGLDKSFHLESTLNQRRDEEITAIMQERERQ